MSAQVGQEEIITLRIDGVDWKGWKSVQIVRSVETIAGGFALGLTDKWAYDDAALPIAAGSACEVLAGKEPIITGYVDKVTHSLSATDHGISVEGRDKTGDLVDCAAVHSPGQWTNADAAELATVLAQPFGIAVTKQGDIGGVFPSFKIEPGENAFDALKRAFKQRELLGIPDGKGGLIIAKFPQDTAGTTLVQGENVLTCSASYDGSQRYSDYIVQGQKQGTDKEYGAACSVKGAVHDEGVTRYRPKVLRSGQQGDAGYIRKRAVWEKTTRAAKSATVTVRVQGWRMDDGKLWPLGQKVKVKLPYLRVEQELMIAKVTYSKSLSGTVTDMELKDPDAFAPEPEDPKKSGTGAGGGSGGGSAGGLDLYVKQSREAKASGQQMQGAL